MHLSAPVDENDQKLLEGVPEDEIGSALDEALSGTPRAVAEVAPEAAAALPAQPLVPPDPSTQWMLGLNEREEGPYSVDQIRELVASGAVTGETLCWKQGLSGWLEISRTPDLAALVAPPPAPEPTPAPYLATAPSVSLSSLAQGELQALSRPREDEGPAEEPSGTFLTPSFAPLDLPGSDPMPSRPLAPPPPAWETEKRSGTTYALVGAAVVIVSLAGAVVYLLQKEQVPVIPPEATAVDAGPAVAKLAPPDVAVAAEADAGEAGDSAADAGADEPPLTPEELAKLPESLAAPEIMKVVLADRDALGGCVDAQQEENRKLTGKLVMRWEILTSGKTTNVQVVTKQFEGSTIATCVEGRIKDWVFPRHRTQGAPVDFPFKF